MFFAEKIEVAKSVIRSFVYFLACCRNPGCKIAKFNPDFLWVDSIFNSSEQLTFAHVGDIGDILFSLHFCKELSFWAGNKKFRYLILTGEKGLSHNAAAFLHPLLSAQSFIFNCEIVERIDEKHIMLDDFRKLKLNLSASDIRSWYYNLIQCHLPQEFWRSVIEVDANPVFNDKILICHTPRYNNVHIDLNYLKEFKNHLVFIGLPHEYDDFCRNFFEVSYQPCKDMLEMAQYMAGAKGIIGNPSGIYSLAECMKIPRIQLVPDFVRYRSAIIPGPHNVHSAGGWHENAASNEKMIVAVKALLEKK